MNYLQKKKLAFMSIVNSVKGFVRTITGALPLTLEGCVDEESITDYTLYGQSVQNGTPTPDSPIEVESVGDKTRNLFDINSATSIFVINSNSTFKKVDGNFVIKRTASANAMGISFSYPFKAGKYALKIGYLTTNYSPNSAYIMYFADKSICVNASSIGYPNTVKQLNIPEDMTVTIVIYANDDNVVGNECTFSIMLSEGYDSVPYEPYGYKVPIKVSGINHIKPLGIETGTVNGVTYTRNKDGSITFSGTPTTDFPLAISTDNGFTANGGTYTLCGCFGGSTSTYYMQTQNGFIDTGNGVTVSTKADKNIIRLHFKKGAVLDDVTIYPMLLKGNYVGKVPDYEPYHEPITTNIYLDEPLRKIGDYADYIDFENGKVVRCIKRKQLTKASVLYTIGGLVGFYTAWGFLDGNHFRIKGLSNREKTFTETLNDSTTIWLGVNNSIVYWIGILSKLGFTTLEQMNSWLSENETWIYWVSKTPTETPITLPNLPTFKGTSILNADTTIQPSSAEIEYYSNVKE